ncbi:MAG TPA: alpha/beta hydrolase [Phenylobacterium sp.]|uniref:alpha/beta hydrolase n=1 Tax=Phenylobacterium sp. TaxID=1871053 RepID=UPI002C9A4657|nr:alpha/beta hydrolase [Phenylobacterium sp.]HSV02782.1 alpha/beta hydrolase [Phenylobacterium sp.]
MSTRHLVDPELAAALEVLPPFELSAETLAATRELMKGFAPPKETYWRQDVGVQAAAAPGLNGAPEVPLVVYRPLRAEGPLPAILFIHGGGYVMGSAETGAPACVNAAGDLPCVVVSVDYRLAPETPAPGPVEDCYAGLLWLQRHAGALGVDASRIAIWGESAGGGLAAALALMARDRAEVPLRLQMLIYPMLDDRTASEGPRNPHVGEFIWTNASNRFGWASLLGKAPGSEGHHPYAVPARAEDLKGLPPAFIAVGSLDLFLQEDLDYAGRLLAAGVPTELHVIPGAYHAFEALAPQSAAAQAYVRLRRDALERALK